MSPGSGTPYRAPSRHAVGDSGPYDKRDDGVRRLLLPQGIDAHSGLGSWPLVARAMLKAGVDPSELPR